MIAYFDTSSIVPLIVDEPSSPTCTRLWNDATRSMAVRLLYPEACAAVVRANRMGRITDAELRVAVGELDEIVTELDHIEVTDALTKAAGELAVTHGLRGYDAVHLAAAATLAQDSVVMVTGDEQLATTARAVGLAVAATSTTS